MNIAKTARELRDEAKRLRARADAAEAAADALDPPKPKPRRRRTRKATATPPAPTPGVEPGESIAARIGEPQPAGQALVLALGTAGHTAHPSDPDAEALRDSLVHTTEAPAFVWPDADREGVREAS
jgi:hypothetical protein